MEQISILTNQQKIILDEVKKSDFVRKNFYLTGGTLLSFYYLQHRLSDDLDFFSEQKFETLAVFNLLQELSQKHHFTLSVRFNDPLYVANLVFENGQTLKVDFAHYPYKRLDKSLNIEGLAIDSLLDIAVNKLLTVNQRNDVKDFVDLYFLLNELGKYTIWDLMEGVKVKFRFEMEPIPLAYDFLKAERFTFLPRMIKPLELSELQRFFRELALEVGGKVIEP